MGLVLSPTRRFPRSLVVTLGAAGAWGAGVVALHAAGGGAYPLCNFRALTGLPCPTCGGTRCAVALLRGDVAEAWRMNPLLLVVLLGGTGLLALRFMAARTPHWSLTSRGRRAVLVLGLVLLAVNWAYLLWVGR